MSSPIDRFLSRHRYLLSLERQSEIDRSALLFTNCSPRLLEQKGLALGNLGVVGVDVGLGARTLVQLELGSAWSTSKVFPSHGFRPGDLARIEPHASSPSKSTKKSLADSSDSSSAVEGVVYKVSDTRITIAIDSDGEIDLPERCRILKLANSVTYDRMEKALDTVASIVSADKSIPPLLRVLLCLTPPSPPLSSQDEGTDITFFDPDLNESQKRAVRFCLAATEVACIWGPPGTGKTHTLIELIRHLTSPSSLHPKGQRVLVCGASNLSVDNILERLLALPVGTAGTSLFSANDQGPTAKADKGSKLRVTRIGHPARVMKNESVVESTLEVRCARSEQAALTKDIKTELEDTLSLLSTKSAKNKRGANAKNKPPRGIERKKMWDDVKALRKEYRTRERGIVTSVLKDSQVVLSTCHSASSRQLTKEEFDVVIIDEATQAVEAVCWIPILKGKKLILAGDPMQLGPTILSKDDQRKEKKEGTKGRKDEKKGKIQAAAKKDETIIDPQGESERPVSEEPPASGSESDPEFKDVESDEDEDDDSDSLTLATNAPATAKPRPQDTSSIPKLRAPRTLSTTLFERLDRMYGKRIKCTLEVQYRMHTQICAFPSRTLYHKNLHPHSSVASHVLSDLLDPDSKSKLGEEETKELLETPVVFFDTAGCDYYERVNGEGGGDGEGSRCNENESEIVKGWVRQLVEAGIEPECICVITPYQAQVALLSSLLRPTYGYALEIGTVDGMQGREKDAVVISLVRSNEKREVGFLKDKRRMNVAMTRAKRNLCIVGDSSTVMHGGVYLKKWMSWLDANADVRYAGLE